MTSPTTGSINYVWTESVLGSAFGGRLLRNGLTAYAICQGWGNRPDDFEPGQPGEDLLESVQIYIATGGADLEADVIMRARIGPAEPVLQPDQSYRLTPPEPEAALRWSYVVDFPSHRIISLDGRTRCGYQGADEGYLAIIAPEAMAEQIPDRELQATDLCRQWCTGYWLWRDGGRPASRYDILASHSG